LETGIYLISGMYQVLPDDVLNHLLTFLPVKTYHKLRILNKEWNESITTLLRQVHVAKINKFPINLSAHIDRNNNPMVQSVNITLETTREEGTGDFLAKTETIYDEGSLISELRGLAVTEDAQKNAQIIEISELLASIITLETENAYYNCKTDMGRYETLIDDIWIFGCSSARIKVLISTHFQLKHKKLAEF
jgi:hypothetical protein